MASRKRPKYKASPLIPRKEKPEGAEKSQKKTKKVTAKAKKPVAKKPTKAPKPKVSSTPFKVGGVSKAVGGGLVGRAAGWAGLAYLGVAAAAPVFRHLFPKKEPWKSTPKLRASQKRMNKAMGFMRDPETEFMGGGTSLGLQKEKADARKYPGLGTDDVNPAKKEPEDMGTLGLQTRGKLKVAAKKGKTYAGADGPATSELKKVTKSPSLKPIKYAETIKDTRAKKSLVRGIKGASGDGPPPVSKSAMRKSQALDFKKYNKSSSVGRSIDDALRGVFSFLGALPKSTDKSKWKNR